jgi:outer membrane protein TolC
MKQFYKILLCFCLSFVLVRKAQSQGTSATPVTVNDFKLPPLQDIIDSALKFSAGVRYRSLDITAKESSLKSQQTYWTRNMGFQADTRYGTFDNFATNATGQSTTLLNTTSKQFNYGMGVFVKMPLADLFDRKNQVKHAETEVEQAKAMEEVQREEIRQTVIKMYQDVLLKNRLMNIKAQGLTTAKLNMEMAEKEFRNGVIALGEFARISEITSRAESDYESGKTEFIISKMLLEEIAGFKF